MSGFGFGGNSPMRPSERALDIADAIFKLVEARIDLEKAKADVPSYTGQWKEADYFANEQEIYYRAAESLEKVLFKE